MSVARDEAGVMPEQWNAGEAKHGGPLVYRHHEDAVFSFGKFSSTSHPHLSSSQTVIRADTTVWCEGNTVQKKRQARG